MKVLILGAFIVGLVAGAAGWRALTTPPEYPCFPRCLWETTGSVLDVSCFMDCGWCR